MEAYIQGANEWMTRWESCTHSVDLNIPFITRSRVFSASSYRGYYDSFHTVEKDWDHSNVSHESNEDGRSRRYFLYKGTWYLSMMATRLIDCMYPIDCRRDLSTDKHGTFITTTVRVLRTPHGQAICFISVLHGKNLMISDPVLKRVDFQETMLDAPKLWRYYEKKYRDNKNIYYVLILAKNHEMNVFTLDPIRQIEIQKNNWHFLDFESGLTDVPGEYGYWSTFGYKCSSGILVELSLHLN